MSTQAAEEYDHTKERIPCKVCDGRFVPGGFKIPIPEGVCIWCATRGRLYQRYQMLWDALSVLYFEHVNELDHCECYGCQVYRSAKPIMGASIKTSEEQALRGRKESQ